MDVPVTPNSFAENSSFRAVLMGASDWPSFEKLDASTNFSNSHAAIHDYLTSKLGLVDGDILDLFDSPDSAARQYELIQDFLERNDDNGQPVYSHLIIYYSGHGDFSQERDFQLVLRETSSAAADMSAFPMKNLAQLVMQFARKATKIVMLDCCFAAASLGNWQMQSTDVQIKIKGEAENRFTEASGTALFCACTEDDWALYNRDDPAAMTMFSGGVMEALTRGDPDKGAFLTVEELEELTRNIIRDKHGLGAVVPVLHVAKGMRDTIITQPLFPNPARKDMEQDVRFTELEASVEMLRGQMTTIQESLDELVANSQKTAENNADEMVEAADDSPYAVNEPFHIAHHFGLSRATWAKLPMAVALRLTDMQAARRGSMWIMMFGLFILALNVLFIVLQSQARLPGFEVLGSPGLHQVLMAINATAVLSLLTLAMVSALPGARYGRMDIGPENLDSVPPSQRATILSLLNTPFCRASELKFFKPRLLLSVVIVTLSALSLALLSDIHQEQWARLFLAMQPQDIMVLPGGDPTMGTTVTEPPPADDVDRPKAIFSIPTQ